MKKHKHKHGDHPPAWMTRQAPAFLPPARRRLKKRRNAGGGGGGDRATLMGTVTQIAAGVGAGVGAYWAASKLNVDPKWATLGVAGVGTAVAMGVKNPVARKIGIGAAIGSGTLGGMSLVMEMRAKAASPAPAPAKPEPKRQADGEGVTRAELQDALTKAAEGARQSQTDLIDVLRVEILRTVESALRQPRALPAPLLTQTRPVGPVVYRGADGYDERNAEGYDERNADGYDERNADGYDERNADGYDERNADGYDERNADGYDERNADGDERNADGYDERNADGDERNANRYDERNAEVYE